MFLEQNKKEKYLQDSYGESIIINNYKDPYNILTRELNYHYRRLDEYVIQITYDKLVELFEPIDDFAKLIFNKQTNKFEKGTEYYKYNDSQLIINAVKNDKEGVYRIWCMFSDIVKCDREELDLLINTLNSTFIVKDNSSQIKILLQSDSGLIFKPFEIKPKPIDIDKMYNDDFKDVHEHLIEKLKGEDKGIVLLHGDAGAGKTNYIKSLTNFVPNKTFVFVAPEFIGELTSPKFIEGLIENKNSVLVLEDSENYMKDRNTSNTSTSIISTLLNISDGILSDILNIQIICTFNTKIDNIDEALRRKGRLIAEYHFTKLAKDKVKVLYDELDIKTEPTEMVLADIFNQGQEFKEVKQKNKLGLTN